VEKLNAENAAWHHKQEDILLAVAERLRRPAPAVGDVASHPIFAFLQGSAPYDGVWFSERHPTEKGAYWWRKHLRAAISAAQADRDAVIEQCIATGRSLGAHIPADTTDKWDHAYKTALISVEDALRALKSPATGDENG